MSYNIEEHMEYFILNINYKEKKGKAKNEVDKWLEKEQIAPIFYRKSTIEQIKNSKGHNLTDNQFRDARNFIDTFGEINKEIVIFSIGNEYIYIYKQDGPLKELPRYQTPNNDLVKGFKIHLIKKVEIKKCPLILVSIKSNRYISSGTFKSLSHERYLGNLKALDYVTGKEAKVSNFKEYLQCLSSIEFETLIAKYLEELGFFVPAYKGGFIKNYDLFCKNNTNKNIEVDGDEAKSGEDLSVQIKLHLSKTNKDTNTDHYFCITSDVTGANIHDHEYLNEHIEKTPNTKKWLETSLRWVKINN